jgi:hypothetical protein
MISAANSPTGSFKASIVCRSYPFNLNRRVSYFWSDFALITAQRYPRCRRDFFAPAYAAGGVRPNHEGVLGAVAVMFSTAALAQGTAIEAKA